MIQASEYPTTRAEARKVLSKHYFTGIPCPKGHVAPRFTSTGGCHPCLVEKTLARHHAGLRGELPSRTCPKCKTTHNRRGCLQCLSNGKYQRYIENLQFVREHKANNPCTDCKLFFSWVVMEFDHRDGRESRAELIAYCVHRNRKVLLAEIAKCDLVCANCHRVRTYERDVLEGRRRLTDRDPDAQGKKTGSPVTPRSRP
jgi:hypothetical protein